MIAAKAFRASFCLRTSVRPFATSRTVLIPSRYAKDKRKYKNSEVSGLSVSSYLNNILSTENNIDWTKIRTQIVGLPVKGNLLVNKNNVDNILWQEILKLGCVQTGIELYNSTQDSLIVRDSNFLKLLVDASESEILFNEEFVISFVEGIMGGNSNTDTVYWNCVSVLSKTSKWREVAEKVAELKLEDVDINDVEDASKVTGYNEFGNFSSEPKVFTRKRSHVMKIIFLYCSISEIKLVQ